MKKNNVYNNSVKRSSEEIKRFTISVLTENRSGLLNGVTIIFTRRKMNIEAINVSPSEVEGVSRYTILIESSREKAEKVVKQIQKLVDVIGAFVYEDDQIYYQELALYKMPTKAFLNGNQIESLVRSCGARILVIEKDHIIIEKTGHMNDTQALFDKLRPFGVLEFVRSGRVAISKSKRETTTFLKEQEAASKIKLKK